MVRNNPNKGGVFLYVELLQESVINRAPISRQAVRRFHTTTASFISHDATDALSSARSRV